MEQGRLILKRHILVANKLLAVMSGLNRQTKQNGTYTYEKHNLGISDAFLSIKWTASLMKQLLTYASKCTSDGTITLISEQEMARTMGCSVRTIQNNNSLLANAGIIQWDRLWGGYIEVSLCNYLEDFLDLHTKESSQEKAEDFQEDEYYSKGGYTSITDEVMYLLLGIRSVNVLRLALRALYTYEKDVNVKKETEALLSYSEIKHILPRYIGYKRAIRQLADKLSSIFKIELFEKEDCIKTFMEEKNMKKSILEKVKDGFILSCSLIGSRDSKKQKTIEKAYAEHLFTRFQSFFHSFGRYEIDKKHIHNLALEFGTDMLEKALQRIQHDLHAFALQGYEASMTIVREIEADVASYVQKIARGYYQAKISA